MTTVYHDEIPYGSAANTSLLNSRFSDLDEQLVANAAALVTSAATTAEVATARDAYGTLDARLDAMVFAGGNVATLTNGAADAGQTTVTVDSTTGFIAGAYVAYVLVGGALEYNSIASITPTTTLTMDTNIGTGGIATDTYIAMISPSEYLAANAIPHTGALTLPQAMEYANDNVYSALAYGVTPASADNAAALQAAIDACTLAGGGDVSITPGTYTVKTAINLKTGVRIKGAPTGSADGGVIIHFNPTSPGAHLFTNVDPVSDYIWGVEVSGLVITAEAEVDVGDAFHLIKPGMCALDRLVVTGFDRAAWLGGAIGVTVSNSHFRNQTVASMEIAASVWASTTVRVRDTFLGEAPTPWAAIVRSDATHIYFDNCVIQSTTEGGIDAYKGSHVWITDCYVEDVPTTAIAKPIYQVGVNDDAASDDAILFVSGGSLGGFNGTHHEDSSAINADEAATVVLMGCKVTRVGNVIVTTVNTGRIEVYGTSIYQTTASPWRGIYNPALVSGSLPFPFEADSWAAPFYCPSLQIKSSGRVLEGWQVSAEYGNTYADLVFESIDNAGAGTNRIEISNVGNVGIGASPPAAKLHVDQKATDGAVPVLTVDQADVSEEFIRFIGTSANGVLTQSIVEKADTGDGTLAGWLKVYVQDDGNQLTDQAYFLPIYTITAP